MMGLERGRKRRRLYIPSKMRIARHGYFVRDQYYIKLCTGKASQNGGEVIE